MKFTMLINVTVPTIIGIFTFIRKINRTSECSMVEKSLLFLFRLIWAAEVSCAVELCINSFRLYCWCCLTLTHTMLLTKSSWTNTVCSRTWPVLTHRLTPWWHTHDVSVQGRCCPLNTLTHGCRGRCCCCKRRNIVYYMVNSTLKSSESYMQIIWKNGSFRNRENLQYKKTAD